MIVVVETEVTGRGARRRPYLMTSKQIFEQGASRIKYSSDMSSTILQSLAMSSSKALQRIVTRSPPHRFFPPSSSATPRQLSNSSLLREPRNTPPPTPIAPRAPAPSRRSNSSQLPLFPLVAIFCIGTGAFYFLVQTRQGQTPAHTFELPKHDPGSKEQWPQTPKPSKTQ